MDFPEGETLYSKISRGALKRPTATPDLPDPAPLTIIQALPLAKNPPSGGEDVIKTLIGAKIVNFGTPEDDIGLEGGGLAIDYVPEGSAETFRIVFSFNECGMSIAWAGSLAGVVSNLDRFDH